MSGELGTQGNPHEISPSDVPYGGFCKCHRCGRVDSSTFIFDYYAISGVGSPMLCEICKNGGGFREYREQ